MKEIIEKLQDITKMMDDNYKEMKSNMDSINKDIADIKGMLRVEKQNVASAKMEIR